MRTLEEEDDEAFKRQFSQYIKHGISANDVRDCDAIVIVYLYDFNIYTSNFKLLFRLLKSSNSVAIGQ